MFFKLPLDAFQQYKVPNRAAFYTMVPIARLQEFRDAAKSIGITFMSIINDMIDIEMADIRKLKKKDMFALVRDLLEEKYYNMSDDALRDIFNEMLSDGKLT